MMLQQGLSQAGVEQRRGPGFGCGRGSDEPGLFAGLQVVHGVAKEPIVEVATHDCVLGQRSRQVGHRGSELLGVGPHFAFVVGQVARHGSELVVPDLVRKVVIDGLTQPVFGAEVVHHQAGRDSGPRGDPAHGGGGEATLPDEVHRGVADSSACGEVRAGNGVAVGLGCC